MASGDYEVVELTECFWIIRSEQDILFEVVTEWICEAQVTHRKSRVIEEKEDACLVHLGLAGERKQDYVCTVGKENE